MILVDKNIKDLANNNELIISGYKEENVNSMSYDLTIDTILKPNPDNEDPIEVSSYTLEPNQFIFIKTKEKLKIPTNILGRIAEKNSLMRTGLFVSGPHYQPGHETFAYLRVYNMSYSKITLRSGNKIAQIIFEELKETPNTPYNCDPNASFNNEITYKGFGNYKDQYAKDIEKMEKIQENIEERENIIYSNVLTFMGLFITLFSIITINYEAFTKFEFSIYDMLLINLSLALIITMFMGLIFIVINKKHTLKFSIAFIILLLILTIANIVIPLCSNDKEISHNNITTSTTNFKDGN